jgi:predicted RNA-binding Zn ribbon-like protein
MERHPFDFAGGTLALDFVNTVSGMRDFNPIERLPGWAELVEWAEQAGLLKSGHQPRGSPEALAQAIAVREALHDVVVCSLEQREPDPEPLAELNRWVADALAHRHLKPTGSGRFAIEYDREGPLWFLRPVAADAAELLQGELERVRMCEESVEGRCAWLFLDTTRNHSRRFCSMKDCGNRAKQRRFQQRKRML